MVTRLIIMIILTFLIVPIYNAYSQEREVLFREDFGSLDNWKPLYFPKIKEHTKYSIEKGESNYLKAETDSSASGIVFKREFNVFEYPKVKWRWKVSNVYIKGNARKRSGDDYPLRVYIMFKFDPEKASSGQRFKYAFAKAVYGEYPPHSSLNYIWANRKHEVNIIINTYAREAKMIVLQTGDENAGKWMEEEINIFEDYQKAFGEDPPETASIAIMSDSDNTKEHAVSYVDYIEVYR